MSEMLIAGQVGGYVAMNAAMPAMLSWVLGGNLGVFKDGDRNPLCHLKDKPKHFDPNVRPLVPQLILIPFIQHKKQTTASPGCVSRPSNVHAYTKHLTWQDENQSK